MDGPLNNNNMRYTNYYTWEDQEYRSFMMFLLTHLEPRREEEGAILFEELQGVNEVVFVEQGIVEIGYDINKVRKFVLRYNNKTVVGAYNCTFSKQSIFVYRCKTMCTG